MKQPDVKQRSRELPIKFKIHAGTYPFSAMVFIGEQKNKAANFVNKKQKRKGATLCTQEHFVHKFGVFISHEKYEPVIWMPKKPKTARQICTVAHEILHVVFECMDWYGVVYDKNSEEAFAYLHTHLMCQFLKKCGIK